MTIRLTAKTFGRGSLGYTQAHQNNGKPVFVRKDHISCTTYAHIDLVNAAIGKVKSTLTETSKAWKTLDKLQDAMFNIGSMIFDTKYATYEVNLKNLISRMESRTSAVNTTLEATEFVKYGLDPIHADWGTLTTQTRLAETVFVSWVHTSTLDEETLTQYQYVLDLLNTMSKWTFAESRAYAASKQLKEKTWESKTE
jgi:cob(I)alamin adenosyltransferase